MNEALRNYQTAKAEEKEEEEKEGKAKKIEQ